MRRMWVLRELGATLRVSPRPPASRVVHVVGYAVSHAGPVGLSTANSTDLSPTRAVAVSSY